MKRGGRWKKENEFYEEKEPETWLKRKENLCWCLLVKGIEGGFFVLLKTKEEWAEWGGFVKEEGWRVWSVSRD